MKNTKQINFTERIGTMFKVPYLTTTEYQCVWKYKGTAVAQLAEALRYKSEGRGFNFRWCHWNFSLT